MKFLFPILFISLQISGNPFASEIVKIPALVMHYYEDKDTQPDLSFLDFIHQHYCCQTEGDHQHEEGMDHEKLPLKHCADCCQHQHNFVQLYHTTDNYSLAVSEQKIDIQPEHNTFPHSQILNSIFQPPRLG